MRRREPGGGRGRARGVWAWDRFAFLLRRLAPEREAVDVRFTVGAREGASAEATARRRFIGRPTIFWKTCLGFRTVSILQDYHERDRDGRARTIRHARPDDGRCAGNRQTRDLDLS